MANTIHYGVIGAGMMGQEHLRNIALLPDTNVAAIFEPDAGMASAAAALAPEAQLCASVDEVLARDALDCLLVAAPNHTHVVILEQISARRPLPLLMEKPLFADPADAVRVAELGAHYPAPIWVAMEYRYMPPVAAFVEQIDAATGGIRMLSIREHRFPFLPKVGNWNRFNKYSGGTLVEKCCHFFDLMRLILRSEPVRVMASAGQDVNHRDEVYDGVSSDIWDGGFVIVDFESGARAMLELCMYAEGSRYQEEICAVGPTGKIEVKVPGPTRFWNHDLGAPPEPKIVTSPRHPTGPREGEVPVDPALLTAGDHNGSTFYQHQQFLKVVRGQGTPEVTLNDGAMAVKMGMAAQQSAIEGRAVEM